MKKRLLSVLLCAAMLCGLLAGVSFATEPEAIVIAGSAYEVESAYGTQVLALSGGDALVLHRAGMNVGYFPTSVAYWSGESCLLRETLADGARYTLAAFSNERCGVTAEKDGVMEAVFLREVYEDYAAAGHRHGCSGIDGVTFAPDPAGSGKTCAFVAYGVYGDVTRADNDYQVILQYDPAELDAYAAPLDQNHMHRCGPESPMAKLFVYTGNTTYGIQNLEYDPHTGAMAAAVYPGEKPQFENFPMFFIDARQKPQEKPLRGCGMTGLTLPLTDLCGSPADGEIVGSWFDLGSTGMISLGDGRFYMARPFRDDIGDGGIIALYHLDRENRTFTVVE